MKEIQLRVLPNEASDKLLLKQKVAHELGIKAVEISHVQILKRSIDARKFPVFYQLKVGVYLKDSFTALVFENDYQEVSNASRTVHIIGSGPAGLFAALEALKVGIKPIIFERGKDIKTRRRDLAAINKEGKVNTESNYCYGEGGAGTYSDGKLYTRSKKRGSVQEVLKTLVIHGAPEDIMVDAHPHIGTNKLPQLIENIRAVILENGGEIHFDTKMTDLTVKDDRIDSITLNDSDVIEVENLVLATGHSARDIYTLLSDKKIALEFKSFALGVRIEHSQQLIDKIQYKTEERGEYLPPASYSLVSQVKDRGVYSFCMCPGGIIAPCATGEEEVVTNGWSPSKRNNPYSNSGIVTEVRWDDIPKFHKYGPLAGMYFQKSIEKKAWELGGGEQKVPAQRMMDFIQGKKSTSLPKTSYFPGITSVELDEVFPNFITNALRKGLKSFGTKMNGYGTNEAVLHATESRTSSPVRIPRDKVTLMHPNIEGLYPCGEGAGYAGGIVSAAIDGIKVIQQIAILKE
jgi:hypothetical protein